MTSNIITSAKIEARIFMLRGEKVMLDLYLSELYKVTTKSFNQAIARHADRFPADFMFVLNRDELLALRALNLPGLSNRRVTNPPAAFTEQGIAMLAGVLNSPRAIEVHIEIIRAFVRLRKMIATSAELSRQLTALEKKYDSQFKAVFDAIRALMDDSTTAPPEHEIGYHTGLPALTSKPKPAKKRAAA